MTTELTIAGTMPLAGLYWIESNDNDPLRTYVCKVEHATCDVTMHWKHMFISTDCLLLARIVRPCLGHVAMLLQ